MGAGNMYPEIFERILHDVAGISENWQVVVRQEGLHDVLEFRLELTNGISSSAVETADAGEPEKPLPRCLGQSCLRDVQTPFPFPSSRQHRAGKKAKAADG